MKEKIVSYLGARHRGNPQCLVFHHLDLTKPLVDEWAFVTPHWYKRWFAEHFSCRYHQKTLGLQLLVSAKT